MCSADPAWRRCLHVFLLYGRFLAAARVAATHPRHARHTAAAGLQSAFRVDQEIGGDDHLIPGLQPLENLKAILEAQGADLDLHRSRSDRRKRHEMRCHARRYG